LSVVQQRRRRGRGVSSRDGRAAYQGGERAALRRLLDETTGMVGQGSFIHHFPVI